MPKAKKRSSISKAKTAADPIFALIEAHKRADKVNKALLVRHTALENKFGVNSPETSINPAPIMFQHWSFSSVEDINRFLSQKFTPDFARTVLGPKSAADIRKVQNRLRRKIMHQWNQAQAKQRRLQEKCGWAPLQRQLDKACDDEMAAYKAVCSTVPTTAEGYAAWLRHLRSWVGDELKGLYRSGATDAVWDTLERSAKRFATH